MNEALNTEVTLYTRGKTLNLDLLRAELTKIEGLQVKDIKQVDQGYTLYLESKRTKPHDIFNMGVMVGMLAMEIIGYVKFDIQLTNKVWNLKIEPK